VKFSNNTETIIGSDLCKKVNTMWKNNLLNNSTRTFLFKLHNNTLGYNHAVTHFVHNHSPNCTFCDLMGNQEMERETPLHLFFMCDVIEGLLTNIFAWLMGDNDFTFTRQEFFTGFNREGFCSAKNDTLTLVSNIIKKFIWDSKVRYCLPNYQHLQITIKLELDQCTRLGGSLEK
jgi:hypothetical protein